MSTIENDGKARFNEYMECRRRALESVCKAYPYAKVVQWNVAHRYTGMYFTLRDPRNTEFVVYVDFNRR